MRLLIRLQRVSGIWLLVIATAIVTAALPVVAWSAGDTASAHWVPSPVQTIYRQGVPQVDGRGRVLLRYVPGRSFLPIAIYQVPLPGVTYGYKYSWSVLKNAGFNTVWAWYGHPRRTLTAAAKAGLHVILITAQTPALLREIRSNPHVLANVWRDEPPTIPSSSVNIEGLFRQFVHYKHAVSRIDPHLLVFVNDTDWITPPSRYWWVKWDQANDIACADDYEPNNRVRMASLAADPCGIPQVVSLEVRLAQQRKPVWMTVGAYQQLGPPPPHGGFAGRFPSPTRLRAEVYAAIISGATGISYFCWDNYIARSATCVGISPDPRVAYVPDPQKPGYPKPHPATPMELVQSRALWYATTQINHELIRLTPEILSPTIGAQVDYKVAVKGQLGAATSLRCLLKPDPHGGYVLLTVNLGDTVLTARYTFSQPLREVAPMFENRQPRTFQSPVTTFKVRYYPIETRIFHLWPCSGDR